MSGYKRKRPTYKKKTYKKSHRKPTVKKRVKMIKRVILKQTETKRLTNSFGKCELYHNTLSVTQIVTLNDSWYKIPEKKFSVKSQRSRPAIGCR